MGKDWLYGRIPGLERWDVGDLKGTQIPYFQNTTCGKKNMNSLIPPDCKIDSFLLEYDLLSGYFVTNKFNNPDFLLTHVKKPE